MTADATAPLKGTAWKEVDGARQGRWHEKRKDEITTCGSASASSSSILVSDSGFFGVFPSKPNGILNPLKTTHLRRSCFSLGRSGMFSPQPQPWPDAHPTTQPPGDPQGPQRHRGMRVGTTEQKPPPRLPATWVTATQGRPAHRGKAGLPTAKEASNSPRFCRSPTLTSCVVSCSEGCHNDLPHTCWL